MYVLVNNLDYESLLDKLIAQLDLKDSPDIQAGVTKALKLLSERFNTNRRSELTEPQVQLVEYFIANFRTMSYSDYDEGNESFAETLAEEFEEALIGLTSLITDELDDISDESKEFVKMFNEVIPVDENHDDPIEVQLSEFVDLVTKYTGIELEPVDYIILKELECALAQGEYVSSIEVFDKPGTQVTHGNTLITFPLILIKAIPNV